MRVRDAAAYLGISTKMVRLLITSHFLPAVQLKPGTNSPYLLDKEDLDELIRKWKLTN